MLNKGVKRILKGPLQRWGKFLVERLAAAFRLNLLTLAYNNIGILKYESYAQSGERYFIQSVLSRQLNTTAKSVFFDVGANIGMISILLRETFPQAEIWAFEPNKYSFDKLVEATRSKGIRCFKVGFGNSSGNEVLFFPTTDQISEWASTHRGVFNDFYKTGPVEEMSFEMKTVDGFCLENNIDFIDFIKIDTEGGELSVMEGASRMLSEGRIGIIQFEFGESHVFARTFMRDFYKFLQNYRFFRLDTNRLIALGNYSVSHEIFRFQNIVAIHRSVKLLDSHNS